MNGLLHHLDINLRLYFRNRMALLYSYLFPVIYLVCFGVLYRTDPRPFMLHMGELLTVAILGGTCFGLPTSMVGERERGVWRRYRLAPVPTRSLIASTAVARYLIALTAGLLQLAIAVGYGYATHREWLPVHPLDLFIVFTFVAFAFLGLGLVMAMLADNVMAVQALGQCVFLPMLIVGGVGVQITALAPSVQNFSAFMPGRYAVDAIQKCVKGNGLNAVHFDLFALFLIGVAGCLAATKMFRWDAQQKFSRSEGKAWVGLAFAAWIAVGLAAEYRGMVHVDQSSAIVRPVRPNNATEAPATADSSAHAPATPQEQAPAIPPAPVAPAPAARMSQAEAIKAGIAATSWTAITNAELDALPYDRLQSDDGNITPWADEKDVPENDVAEQLKAIRANLPEWKYAKVADPVERVHNLLFVAAVPDAAQLQIEKFTPQIVYERLLADIPRNDLLKILGFIAYHPKSGDAAAAADANWVGFGETNTDFELAQDRAGMYAMKMLLRIP